MSAICWLHLFVCKVFDDEFGKQNAALLWTACITIDGLLALLTSPMIGALSDRFGRTPMQAYAVLMSAPMHIGLAVGMRGVLLVVLFLLRGLGGSPFAIGMAYAADLAEGSAKQVKMQTLIATSISPAISLGPIVVSLLFEAVGDRMGWIILSFIVILNATYVRRVFRCTRVFKRLPLFNVDI